jgi:putative transposase
MYLTFKAKITTDKKTEAILDNICFSATKLYNTVNWYLRSEWQHDRALCDYCDTIGYPHNGVKIPLNRTELQTQFKDNHWAKNMHSQSAQFIIGEVINAYKSWFALRRKRAVHRDLRLRRKSFRVYRNGNGNSNPPGFRPKANLSPVTFVQGAPALFNKNGKTYLHLSLGTKREDGIREITVILYHRKNLPGGESGCTGICGEAVNPSAFKGTLNNVRITYDTATGNYYAHLVFDVPVKKHPQQQLEFFPTNVVAIDLGLNNIITATFSDGSSHIVSGRELKAIRRYWQKVRTKVKPPSVTKRKPSRRYRKICGKESRQIRHRLHIISKQFVELCEGKGVTDIVLGDLSGIRNNINYSKRLNQQLHNWNFAQLIDFIKYKAERIRITVELISEKYTSQTCCACGTVDKSNRKTRGLYVCNCGNRINADRNGANNILKRYLRNRSSGSVALPVVTLVLSRTDAHCLRTYKHSVAHKAS